MDTITNRPAAPRDWTFIVFKMAGHGLAGEMRQGLAELGAAGTAKAANITVRAEHNGVIDDYVVTDGSTPGPHLQPMPGGSHGVPTSQQPMMAEQSMQQLLLDTMRRYPAQHYFVSFEGHSHRLRQMLGPVHLALAAAAQANGGKLDVLALDACFMAQVESANEFADVAQVLVASEESMAGWRHIEKIAPQLDKTPMDAHQMGHALVAASTESTLSALDLSQVDAVNARMKDLADAVQGVHDGRSLATIRQTVDDAQHFYVEGWKHVNVWHNTVDIVDMATRLSQQPQLAAAHPQLAAAAQAVAAVCQPAPHGFVIAEKHSDAVTRGSLLSLDYIDVRHAHGVSMHLPTTAPLARSSYTHLESKRFEQATGWDAAIHHLTADCRPGYLIGSTLRNLGGGAMHVAGTVLDSISDLCGNLRGWWHSA